MHQQKHMYWTHISIHSAMKTLAQKSHLKEKSIKVYCYNYKKPLSFMSLYQSHLILTKARHESIVTDKTCEGTILIRLQYHIFFLINLTDTSNYTTRPAFLFRLICQIYLPSAVFTRCALFSKSCIQGWAEDSKALKRLSSRSTNLCSTSS